MSFLQSIIARVSMDGSDFELGAKRVEGSAAKMAHNIESQFKSSLAQAFSVYAVEEFGRSVINLASHIKDLSEQTALSTDEVQRIGYAAKDVGLQFEDFEAALSKMGVARREAVESNDKLLRSFKQFGVSMDDLQDPAKRNVDLLYQMANAIKNVDLNAGDREALREFFGKSGDKLAQAISQIDQFKNRPIISSEDVQAIDRLDKSIQHLYQTAQVFASGPIADTANNISTILDSKKSPGERFEAFFKQLLPMRTGRWIATHIYGIKVPELPPTPAVQKQPGASLSGNGQLFEDQRPIELLKQEAELRKLIDKYALNSLDADQQKVKLQKDINDLLLSASLIKEQYGDSAKANELLQQAAEKNNQLQDLNKKRGKDLNNDSLNRMGIFVGGSETIMANTARQSLEANKQTAANTAEIIRIMKASSGSALDE